MFNIGSHLSISKGFDHIAREAHSVGANTFQFFTRNPRGSKGKAKSPDDIAEYVRFAQRQRFAPIVAHAPYTLNPCAAVDSIREFAELVLTEDLRELEKIPNCYYNFHPGSHVGQGIDVGIDLIVTLVNRVLEKQPDFKTLILLETMSGKGSEVGSRFEELRRIIDGIERADRIGVCLDTCHVYSAGYDIVGRLDDILDEFDSIIGLSRLKAVHLNDSLTEFGSHKDRHAPIGAGSLGFSALANVCRSSRLSNLPFILETPNDLDGWAREIRELRAAVE